MFLGGGREAWNGAQPQPRGMQTRQTQLLGAFRRTVHGKVKLNCHYRSSNLFIFNFPCVTSCPRGAVPVCRGWVGFLHGGNNKRISLFVFCMEGCARSHSLHEHCTEPGPGMEVQGTLKGNASHPSASLKAITTAMTWSLFINPRCSWPGEKAQWEQGVYLH